MEISKVEMFRQALRELGEVSAQEMTSFIEQRHGVRIDARFIPVLRAAVRGQEMLQQARHAAREATQSIRDSASVPADDAASPR